MIFATQLLFLHHLANKRLMIFEKNQKIPKGRMIFKVAFNTDGLTMNLTLLVNESLTWRGIFSNEFDAVII